MNHSLTLGSLTLTGSADFPDDEHGFWFEVCAEGTEFGSPEAVTRIVTSLMMDGAIVSYDSDANRTVPVRVRVNGPTLAAVAHGEAALRRESKRRNELTWQPPDDFAPPSVFETYPSPMPSVQESGWDLDELRHKVRTFGLRLTCAPFARSVELTVAAALPIGGGTDTVVDTCDSATGWTGKVNGVSATPDPAWLGLTGSLFVYDIGAPGPQTMSLTRTGTFSVATTPHLRVSVVATQLTNTWCDAVVDGVSRRLQLVSQQKSTIDDDLYDFIWVVPAGSSSISAFTVSNYSSPDASAFGIAEVKRLKGPSTAARQVTRVLEVGGTERTPGSLHAFTSSGYLGNTVLHTTPYMGTGYTPDMQRWRASGNATTANVSSRRISGTWEELQPNPVIARMPADQLPRGDYILMAAVKSSLPGERAVSWAVKSLLAGSVIGNTTGIAYYNFEVADRLEYVPLGVVSAPVVSSSGLLDVEVHLANPSPGTVSLYVEEWWMFTDGPDSALSIVGSDEGELWLDSADVNSSVPRAWVGNANGQKFHPHARLLAHGSHAFIPGQMQVTTISDANDYLEVDLSYYKRWHSNAAE